MELTVTQQMIDRAKLAGACGTPEVGTAIEELTQDQMDFASSKGLVEDGLLRAFCGRCDIPPWALSGDGFGCYGYGYGSGYGSGYGDGWAYCAPENQ